MKRIVISLDGTWNRPDDEDVAAEESGETNVFRFHMSVGAAGPDGIGQDTYYDTGVGTGRRDRLLGGATGFGVSINICEAYRHLAKTYEQGDEVFILGFSRGAFSARSLVGMIQECGLVGARRADVLTAVAWTIYGARRASSDRRIQLAKAQLARTSRPIRVKFLGVWDTVGALGIPSDIPVELANVVPISMTSVFEDFHDVQLAPIVDNAVHAMAIDEHRKPYEACLWSNSSPGQTVEQRWFAGAHCNVGGGYPDRRLSDVALHWMQSKAQGLGLGLTPVTLREDNHSGTITDSYSEFLRGHYARLRPRHFRTIGASGVNEVIDESVRHRIETEPNYQPQNLGLQGSLSVT